MPRPNTTTLHEPTPEDLFKLPPEQRMGLLCLLSFPHFCKFIFAQALTNPKFRWGWHLEDYAERLQNKKRTSTRGARKHAKSTLLYAYILWHLYRLPLEPKQILFLSYSDSLARYHLRQAKEYFTTLEQMGFFPDLTPRTDSLSSLDFQHNHTRNSFYCFPKGITGKMRGLHPDGVIADDILGDLTQRLSMVELDKVKELYLNSVEQLPKEGGWLHVAGNPQAQDDLLDHLARAPDYDAKDYPAIIGGTAPTYADGEILWPEMFTMERLQRERETIKDERFARQWMCIPASLADSLLEEHELLPLIDNSPNMQGIESATGLCYAGIDLGKVKHPAYIAVVCAAGDGHLYQKESIYLEKVNYVDQLAICKDLIDKYHIQKFLYDNTRGEFTVFQERNELPYCMEAITMNAQNQTKLVSVLLDYVKRQAVTLYPDRRALQQMLSVDRSFQAPETAYGHGDALWAVAMACYAASSAPKFVNTLKREDMASPSWFPDEEMDFGSGNLFDQAY